MKVGHKIHKIRELKNITAKDMADRLDMTTTGYQKIERDEVSINMDRLLEIAGIFEMKPEEVLTFDEKYVFNNHGTAHDKSFSVFYETQSSKVDQLYEDKIKLLEEKNALLLEQVEILREKIRGLEGR